MKIVMLGNSNSGKTSYMASMYALMNRGRRGFQVVADSTGHHQELLQNAALIARGDYPPPSSQRSEYSFRLRHRKRPVFAFTWQDYRGGALSERAGDNPETAQLLNSLRAADGIVMFVDAAHMATSPRAASEARRLTMLCQRALENHNPDVPVVIAYTKADLVSSRSQWAAAEEPLASLQQSVLRSPKVRGLVTRVSCHPSRNLHAPVMWLVASGLSARVAQLHQDTAGQISEADQAKQRITFGNSAKCLLTGEKSWARIEAEHRAAAAQLAQEAAGLKSSSRKLTRISRRVR